MEFEHATAEGMSDDIASPGYADNRYRNSRVRRPYSVMVLPNVIFCRQCRMADSRFKARPKRPSYSVWLDRA